MIKAYNGPTATTIDTILILASCLMIMIMVGYGIGLFLSFLITQG